MAKQIVDPRLIQPQPSPADIANRDYLDIEKVQALYGDGLINTAAGSRGNYFSLDPGGIFGTRQAAIESAAKTFDGNKFKLGLNEALGGITQQDVANWYMTQYDRARSLDPLVKDARNLFPEGQQPNAATPQRLLEQNVNRIKQNKSLTSQIKALDQGPSKLQEAEKNKGSKLTNSELEGLLSDTTNSTRSAVQSRETADATIDSLKSQTETNEALASEQIDASKASTQIAQGTLDLAQVNSTNSQTQQEYVNDTDSYRYEDGKVERNLQRQFEAAQDDAKFAANLETVRLQNAAEMERYELMLQNDKEVRRGDSISDLMASLTMLGGAFLI